MAGMLIGVVKLEDVLKEDSFELAEPDDAMMDGGDSMSGDEMRPPVAEKSAKGDKKQAKPDLGQEMGALKRLTSEFYYPRVNLTARVKRLGSARDSAIIADLGDELLPVPLSETSRLALLDFLRTERSLLGVEDGALLGTGARAENVLRRLAHLILSLPEAQLG
jgi:hypothetical protein